MAFGPIMRFVVDELQVELAPLTRESMSQFVDHQHGGGMQRYSVTRYMGRRLAPTLEDEYAWFDKVSADQGNIMWGIWVVDGAERTLIGNSSLKLSNQSGGFGPIRRAMSGSVIFRPEYWGRGIASAAHQARAWYAFSQLGLHCIDSGAIEVNGGSRKALSRSGYRYTHTDRNAHYVDGGLHSIVHYQCLNPLDLFWHQWWHGDRPPAAAVKARQFTRQAMDWASKNVELT